MPRRVPQLPWTQKVAIGWPCVMAQGLFLLGLAAFARGQYLFAAVLCVVPAPLNLWGALRVQRADRALKERARRGEICGACLYDLTGNESGVCPECGTKAG